MVKVSWWASRFLLYVVLPVLSLLFLCSFIIPAYKEYFAPPSSVNDGRGNTVLLEKAVFADACNAQTKACLKGVLLISGNFEPATGAAIIKLAKSPHREVTTVCFRSNGGSNDVAKPLMNIIREGKLNTCLADEYHLEDGTVLTGTRCLSACPLVVLAGAERINLGENLKIGIHHSGQAVDFCFFCWRINSGGSDFADYLKGSPDSEQHLALFKRSRLTDTNDIDLLSPAEWRQYRVFTQYQ